MTTPTDTPRTDAEEGYMGECAVEADFARTLERELAQARSEIARLKAHLSGVASKPVNLQWHYVSAPNGAINAQLTAAKSTAN